MKTKKNVLIISYNFPPMGGGGVIRIVKFCKYLPQFNWNPIVLTVREHDSDHLDENLFSDLMQTNVSKTYSIDLPLIYKKLTKFNSADDGKSCNIDKSIRTNYKNIMKKIVNNFIFIPDSRIGWIPFAYFKGLKMCKDDRIDLIFSTGGPWTNHLIGAMLKKTTRLPWVTDFRDSWTEDPFTLYPFRLRKRLEEKLEKYVLLKSDSVISATHSISQELISKYPEVSNRKYFVVTNGFDGEEFCQTKKHKKNGFLITHTGNFYGNRNAKYFLIALKKLLDENSILQDEIKVNLVGIVNKKDKNLISKLNLSHTVKCLNSVSHEKCIKLLAFSDLLLLIIGTEKSEVTGKVYEYMAAKKHIFALTGKGEVTNILERSGNATIVGSKNVAEIKNALYSIYMKHKSNDLTENYNSSFVNKFDRKNLTFELTTIFNQVVQ